MNSTESRTDSSRPSPLSSLRVIELGEFVAVPYAGKMLADLGADVVKVERPGHGDVSRSYGPFPAGLPDAERSGLYSYLNSNKRGVTLDISLATGQDILAQLAETSDVMLIDQAHMSLLPDAVTPESLAQAHEKLVVTSVSPFGRTGTYRDYRGYDITCSAAGGISAGVGKPDMPPLPLPLFQCDFQGGISAAIASLIAIFGRAVTGRGQHVDISISEAMASLHTGYHLPRYIYGGGVVGLRNWRTGSNFPYPNTVLACADGLVELSAPQVAQWVRFLHVMGDPEWSNEPRYRNRRAMQSEYKEEADALLAPWFAQRTKRELLKIFVENRIPFAPLHTAEDLLTNDHMQSRGSLAEYEFPEGGTFQAPSVPYRFTEGSVQFGRPPMLGEHNDAIYRERLGISSDALAMMHQAGAI